MWEQKKNILALVVTLLSFIVVITKIYLFKLKLKNHSKAKKSGFELDIKIKIKR